MCIKMIHINKKDIVAINQGFSDGSFQNESSLDFALSIINQKRAWLFELSYLVRSLLVDHSFKDGNKRTAMALILLYLEDRDLDYDKDIIVKTVWDTAKKNYDNINKIVRLIKSGISS